MRFQRSAGVLVHPTSFPGSFGLGDLGPSARIFLDFLHDTDQTIWQVLPLGPTGYGYSPYASYSAFAGNPYLISPEILLEKGLLKKRSSLPVLFRPDWRPTMSVHLRSATSSIRSQSVGFFRKPMRKPRNPGTLF